MKRILMLVLTAAITVGLLGCASKAPRTPEELERWAKEEEERLIKKEESVKAKRKRALRDLAHSWEAFRGASFTPERLLKLKAICLMAQDDWSSETRRLLWMEIRQFGDLEVLSFFKQVRYSDSVVIRIAEATLNINRKLRAFVQTGDLSLKELRDLWGGVTAQAQFYVEQEWWEQ